MMLKVRSSAANASGDQAVEIVSTGSALRLGSLLMTGLALMADGEHIDRIGFRFEAVQGDIF